MFETYMRKDGPNVLKITVIIDITKPKCWVKNGFYKFNTKYISIERAK